MNKTKIIADIGCNHMQVRERALALIRAATDAGADCIKFQLWGKSELWHGDDMRCATTDTYALPEAWISDLHDYSKLNNLEFMCTPFSVRAVGALNQYVKAWKVASGDITFTPMLSAIAKTRKPVILSVGASTESEIEEALYTLRASANMQDVTILHCIPDYPATPAEANIRAILDLKERFGIQNGVRVGLSSHLKEWWCDVAALAYGIDVIEKHIDLHNGGGIEAGHSLNPTEFKQFVSAVRDTEAALKVRQGFNKAEEYARDNYRRNPKDWLRPNKRG